MEQLNKIQDQADTATRGYLRSIVYEKCPNYVENEGLAETISLLNAYCFRDPDFEKNGLKLDKGLMICGNTGTGKTLLMSAVATNRRIPFLIIPTNRIVREYQEFGLEQVNRYFVSNARLGLAANGFMGYCFDDLGAECLNAKYMGNEMNVMAEIILERYARKQQYPFYRTHFTTNLSPIEIQDMYGARIKSRLHEMVNIIVLGGDDHRKGK